MDNLNLLNNLYQGFVAEFIKKEKKKTVIHIISYGIQKIAKQIQ